VGSVWVEEATQAAGVPLPGLPFWWLRAGKAGQGGKLEASRGRIGLMRYVTISWFFVRFS
jgi:hypothetical protein